MLHTEFTTVGYIVGKHDGSVVGLDVGASCRRISESLDTITIFTIEFGHYNKNI